MARPVTWTARHLGRRWSLTSRIVTFDRPRLFIDEQVSGPFRSFRHVHSFEPAAGGTLVVDEWEHSTPLGPLGWLIDHLLHEPRDQWPQHQLLNCSLNEVTIDPVVAKGARRAVERMLAV